MKRTGFWMSMAAVAALAVIIGAGTAGAQTPPPEYVITGAVGTGFSAHKDGNPAAVAANPSIQPVIDAIKGDAAGSPCTIQFGSGGTNVLNIGTGFIEFNGGTGGGTDWGQITLRGRVTSEYATATDRGTIFFTNGVSVSSEADIGNSSTSGRAIVRGSTGTLNITGGTVSANNVSAIHSPASGVINISGTAKITSAYNFSTSGTITMSNGDLNITGDAVVENTANGCAVYNNSTGTINISGGKVSAKTYYAVRNDNANGTVNISGSALITSAIDGYYEEYGTIYMYGGTLNITGGTVENTSADGNAVAFEFSAKVTVSAGTVSVKAGVALKNRGTLILSGGTISTEAPTVYAVYNVGQDGEVFLDGDPNVTGIIKVGYGKLSLDNGFSPAADRLYTIVLSSYPINAVVVKNIGSHQNKFRLHNQPNRPLTVDVVSNNLVAEWKGDQNVYVVTGSDRYFTATFGATTLTSQVQGDAIGAIKTHVGGLNNKNCTILFGSGADTLNVTDVTFTFDGDWGLITLTGKLKATSQTLNTTGTIEVKGAVSIESKAELTKIGQYYLINHNSTGTITVSGGSVSTIANYAIRNNSTGTIVVSSGKVSALSWGVAIYNNAGGTVKITGGTVSAENNIASGVFQTGSNAAVYNNGAGTVEILGGTVLGVTAYAVYNYNAAGTVNISGSATTITSARGGTDGTRGTIYINNGTLNMAGGTVENTAATSNDGAININNGTVRITGGTVTNTAGYGIQNGAGTVTVSGGDVVSVNRAIYNRNGGTVTINGNARISSTRAAIQNLIGIVNISDGAVVSAADTAILNGYNNTAAAVNISGGATIKATDAIGTAIYNPPAAANATVALSGNPTVEGIIKYNAGKLSVDNFNPSPVDKVYMLELNAYSDGAIAVFNGKPNFGNFKLYVRPEFDGLVLETNNNNNHVVIGLGPYYKYVITGDISGSFTAKRSGVTIGTNWSLQTVIGNIRTNANGNDCIIQFGNGTDPLDLAFNFDVEFNGNSGSPQWGQITFTGKITCDPDGGQATMIKLSGVSVVSYADFDNIRHSVGVSGEVVTAIDNGSNSNLTIAGGNVLGSYAVKNSSDGSVTIAGGTISGYYAVYNNSNGSVTVTGGTVTGNAAGAAIYAVNSSGATVSLGGDPEINGPIAVHSLPIDLIANGSPVAFNPLSDRRYKINTDGYADGDLVVKSGGGFLDRFEIAGASALVYELIRKNITDDIVLSMLEFFCEGTGTADDPFLICTDHNLARLAVVVNFRIGDYYKKQYKLKNDINLADNYGSGFDGGKGWSPIGNNTYPFEGTFDGNEKKITGLYINRPDQSNIGLFGYVNVPAGGTVTIEDLTVEAGNVRGTSAFVGGLAGYIAGTTGEAVIKNCGFTGTVTTTSTYVGGLVGISTNSLTIKDSHAEGDIAGVATIGGLVGSGIILKITDSYYMGNVVGTATYVGGLAGYISSVSGEITGSYAKGEVTGLGYIGGLAGLVNGGITNSYAAVDVTRTGSTNFIGGLAGRVGGNITYSYATGKVTATGTDVGGLAGYVGGTVTSSYWDKERSGQTTSAGGLDKTTSEMRQEITYANWNFNATDGVWGISEGTNYPYLKSLPKAELIYTADANGTVSSGAVSNVTTLTQIVNYGVNGEEVVAVPASGYIFEKWSDNEPDAVRTDNNNTADKTFTASFEAVAPSKVDPDMSGITFTNSTVVYNGSSHSISLSGSLPSGVSVSYTGNGQTNAGSYTVTAVFDVDDPATHNVPASMTATLTINKASYDMSGITFNGATVTYDNVPHSIYISGSLPTGVTVSYANNGQTNAGSYTVTATFTVTDPANYNVPASMPATLTINKASYDMSVITFNGATVTYDNVPHSIYISGTLPTGVTVSYTGNNQTAAGTYTVTAVFAVADAANYNVPASMPATLTINKASYDMSGITFTGATVTYDGAPHSIYISGTLPSGVTVSYTNNGKTAVESYTVTANFTTADPNYNAPSPSSMTAVLEIAPPLVPPVPPTPPVMYAVTVSSAGNGTASASVSSASAGTVVSLSAVANSGYAFKEWRVTSGGAVISGDMFTMPASAVRVTAYFEFVKIKVAKPYVTNTALVYTGKELSAGIASNAAYTVTGDRKTNAGVYAAKVALKDKTRYEWDDGTVGDLTLEWSIEKAEPDFDKLKLSAVYTPTLKLSNVTLPTGYAWVEPTERLFAGEGQTFAATYTDRSGNYNSGTGYATVNVAKAAGKFVAHAALNATYSAGLSLSDLALSEGYEWSNPGTQLNAGNSQRFTALFTGEDPNYDKAAGSVTVNVAKAVGAFVPHAAVSVTYSPSLRLSGAALSKGYAWSNPSRALTVGDNQIFAASFTDPSGNYTAAVGEIAVSVGKAAGVFVPHSDINAPYTPTLKLSDLALAKGYKWTEPNTSLSAGSGQKFAAEFVNPDGNYFTASGEITVNVQVFAGLEFVKPISNKKRASAEISDTAYSGEVYRLTVRAVDQDGGAIKKYLRLSIAVLTGGISIPKTIMTDAGTGVGICDVSIAADATVGGRLTVRASAVGDDGVLYSDTADLLVEKRVSVSSSARVVPGAGSGEAVVVAVPAKAPAAGLSAGPNPAVAPPVRFFRTGGRIKRSTLYIYDASGGFVNTVKIEESGAASSAQGRRLAGAWDLTDAKGRRVSEGTYAVRGAVATVDGRREKVSLSVNVRRGFLTEPVQRKER